MLGWLRRAARPQPSPWVLERWIAHEAERAERERLTSLPTPVLDRLNDEARRRVGSWCDGGSKPEPVKVSHDDFDALRKEFENQGMTKKGAPWPGGSVYLCDCVRVELL